MAIKIGKWYITRNNPRELLLQLRYKQDIIDELEEWLKTEWNNKNYGAEYKIALSKVYNKLQELKEKQMIEDLDIYEDIEDDEDNLE